MISCTEIKAVTERAEERERQKIIDYINQKKDETREYCSETISEQLIKRADIPSHKMIIYTKIPDGRGMANICDRDGDDRDTYSPTGKDVHVETLVDFIREHGFNVTIEQGQYKYSARTYYPAKVITIEW